MLLLLLYIVLISFTALSQTGLIQTNPYLPAKPFANMKSMQNYLPLDGLRFIAIVMVVMTHTQVGNAGGVGVAWFFVLSAFALTYSSLKQKTDFRDYKQLISFFRKRGLRVLIPYWIVLLVYLLFLSDKFIFTGFLKNLTLIEPFGYNTWFLRPLIIFYLLFPFLFMFNKHVLKDNIFLILLFTGVIPLIAHLILLSTESKLLYLSDFRAPMELLSVGMLIAYLFLKKRSKYVHFKEISLLCIILLAIILFMTPIWEFYLSNPAMETVKRATFGLFSNPIRIRGAYTLQAVLFGAFLLFYLWENGPVQKILNSKVMKHLGAYSYEIYLVHTIIYLEVLKPLVYPETNTINSTTIFLFLLTLALSYLVSLLFKKIVNFLDSGLGAKIDLLR
ncbi:hypothetical protein A2886_01915 [candidate division WWE3 bacterium RIFCSPHIGHO2_01_FULL_42_13]|uniref:Acyltransferase 3 domain-containing protein n=1 Tax=candidate division WWE3 bacterium RIFCSPHIGHO2_01_FULL_42_13 TaxID=1802617 RepID=A0A1F4URD2_UNCKA|nr:MAG: hypothetical protein A2886_01915 [candidate division WWE3 bacterium RIFCSPHIGHO2_01_FULL_42_13]